MTNGMPFDSQVQSLFNSLPPNWEHYATSIVLILMILGRVATSAMTSGGIIPIFKSVFMGSVHTDPTVQPPQLPTPPVQIAPPAPIVTPAVIVTPATPVTPKAP